MMKAIIVDDEPLALDILETYLERIPTVQLVARCNNALEALDVLQKAEADLIFLDIEMPQLTGIDFMKSLANPPQVIFTTAYSNYALDGYELNITDYLLKPISFDRFMKAINKAMKQNKRAQAAEKHANESEKADFIFVKADKKLIKIKYEEIFYIEGLKDYVILHTPNGRIVTLQTMKSLEVKLPDELFKRVHRSYIAQLGQIDAVMGNMLEVNGKHIPIGKSYREELLEIINRNRL